LFAPPAGRRARLRVTCGCGVSAVLTS